MNSSQAVPALELEAPHNTTARLRVQYVTVVFGRSPWSGGEGVECFLRATAVPARTAESAY